MNSQLLLLLAVLMPGAVVQAPPENARRDPPAESQPTPPVAPVAHAGPTGNPYRDDASASLAGRRLFVQYHCARCHGRYGRGGIAPSLLDDSTIYGDDPAQLYASIAKGRRYGMPAWGTILPTEDIWKLVTYIESLRTATRPRAGATPVGARRTTSPGAG